MAGGFIYNADEQYDFLGEICVAYRFRHSPQLNVSSGDIFCENVRLLFISNGKLKRLRANVEPITYRSHLNYSNKICRNRTFSINSLSAHLNNNLTTDIYTYIFKYPLGMNLIDIYRKPHNLLSFNTSLCSYIIHLYCF